MATLTLTSRFNDLIGQTGNWSEALLQADDSTTVQTHTGTQFNVLHGAESPFAGCR